MTYYFLAVPLYISNVHTITALNRNSDARSRPQFGQITKLLFGGSEYLLGWSDEDKQSGGEDAIKLGAPLESASSLYLDLQQQYLPKH